MLWVAADLAEECTIQLAYAIGVSKPLSVLIDTNGTANADETKISKVLHLIWTFLLIVTSPSSATESNHTKLGESSSRLT